MCMSENLARRFMMVFLVIVTGLIFSIIGSLVNTRKAYAADPVESRDSWTLTASSSHPDEGPGSAIDGNHATRWSTGTNAANGQWLELDMGSTTTFNKIVLECQYGEYPPAYEVYVSDDGSNWGSAVSSGTGSRNCTQIMLSTQNKRYIKIVQTGSAAHWWGVNELNVYNTDINKYDWTATASVSYPTEGAEKAIDNDYNTRWSTGTVQENGQWFKLDMGSSQSFNQIILDTTGDDYPVEYEVYVSDDGSSWGAAIASGEGDSNHLVIDVSAQNKRYIKIVQTDSDAVHWWGISEINVNNIDPSTQVQMLISPGWNIFDFRSAGSLYRYGPSMILNADGSIDAYFAREGSGGAWDWITHKKSTDGGYTWGDETVVLVPTPDSPDKYSCCDPGVFAYDGYYYIGYTSVDNTQGFGNDIFVARSTSPTGPFYKWNGSGWGGSPQPILTYPGISASFGFGEPSFVVKDDLLYIYYSLYEKDPDTCLPNYVELVATAVATDPNWPAAITDRGVAIRKLDGEDSMDIKYIDAYGKFIGINTVKRFTTDGYVEFYQSDDGIHFTKAITHKDNISGGLHNCGMLGDSTGHVVPGNTKIAYASGYLWAHWNTFMQPVTFSTVEDKSPAAVIMSAIAGNGKVDILIDDTNIPEGMTYKIKYGTSSGSYTNTITGITSNTYSVTGLTNGTKYYFALVTSASYGDSDDSAEVSAVPLNYSSVNISSAAASSQIAGWSTSNAYDDDVDTCWSSAAGSNSTVNWIYFDLGSSTLLKRFKAYPRTCLLCFPEPFINCPPEVSTYKIEVSNDGANWAEVESTRLRGKDGSDVYYVDEFDQPVYARYIRMYSNNQPCDQYGGYYFQLAEAKVEAVPYTFAASSASAGYPVWNAADRTNECWVSQDHAAASNTEWLSIDMGVAQSITGIRVKPRADGGTCFPVDFKFQYSSDNVNWTDISGQSYIDYPNPGGGGNDIVFTFGSPVNARYIRLYATKLGYDGNNYFLQINEMYPDYNIPRSSSAAAAVDNVNSTEWSSSGYGSQDTTVNIDLDLGTSKRVNGLTVVPTSEGIFPYDFKIQYSSNGTSWATVTGQDYVFYGDPLHTTLPVEFDFGIPVTARYIRFSATKLAPYSGTYYLKVAEIYVK